MSESGVKVMDCVEKNKEIYTEAFSKYGDDTRSCLWEQPMIMRYQQLYKIAPLENSTVLDLGCGLGGLYEYFRDTCKVKNLTYTGVDIVEGMIKLASEKYPDATFRTVDIFKEKLEETYDYVFLCGTFNLAMPHCEDFMRKMLTEAFSYCTKGLAFNFISTYVNFKDEETAYHCPQDIFTFCAENLSRKIQMHHHYEKCDVSMFVYK